MNLLGFSGCCFMEFSKLDEIGYMKGNSIIGEHLLNTPLYLKHKQA